MWHSILVALMLQLFTSTLTQDGIQLRTAVDEWLRKSGSETTGFRHALTDLDGDTRTDALVLLRGNAWCGSGGCTLLVFRGSNSGFTFVSKSTIVNEPLRVSSETSSGWKDLIVSAKGFGDVVMQFDGKNYPPVPSNVKASPAQTKAARTVMEPCCVSLYTSDARYESIHEQGLIKVQDGPYLHISLDDVGGLNPEDVLKWQTGRRLLVVYTSEQGAALLDPQTLKSASILDGLSEHPIDVLAERCFQSEAQTTAEMVTCYTKGRDLWDKELNRSWERLMASLDAQQKRSLQNAQREWLQYRDTQMSAFGTVDNDGTLSRVRVAMEAMRLTKEQAQRLARLLSK